MRRHEPELIEQAQKTTVPGGYSVSAGAAFEAMKICECDPLKVFCLAYKMGFIKGQRAAKKGGKS